jgi:hypothetical protein
MLELSQPLIAKPSIPATAIAAERCALVIDVLLCETPVSEKMIELP